MHAFSQLYFLHQTRCGTPENPYKIDGLCSSDLWTEEASEEGIFSAKDPILKAANKVYIRYCTSDAHMGDAAKSPEGTEDTHNHSYS